MTDNPDVSLPSTPTSVEAIAQTDQELPADSADVKTSDCPGEGISFLIGDGVVRAVEGRPDERTDDQPIYRPLKIFALDPSVSRLEGATAVVNVPYERLDDGPCGYFFKVDNATEGGKPSHPPLNLDDLNILINNGINPSTSDERFHEQMVTRYAVSFTLLFAKRSDAKSSGVSTKRQTTESSF